MVRERVASSGHPPYHNPPRKPTEHHSTMVPRGFRRALHCAPPLRREAQASRTTEENSCSPRWPRSKRSVTVHYVCMYVCVLCVIYVYVLCVYICMYIVCVYMYMYYVCIYVYVLCVIYIYYVMNMYIFKRVSLNTTARRLRRLIRNIENKLINCQLVVVFNETFLNEDILPIYTNIHICHICIHIFFFNSIYFNIELKKIYIFEN